MVIPVAVNGTSGERDRSDPPRDASESPGGRPRRRWPARRLALGLSPTPRSGLLLLLAGMALGPHGLRVLSAPVLGSLDPVVSVALIALGVLVGLDVKARPSAEGRLLALASLNGAITILFVALGMTLVGAWSSMAEERPWLLALMLGICAAPSSTPADDAEVDHPLTTRVGDLDDVLPIVLSVLAIVWVPHETPASFAWLPAQGALLAVAIAFAARLLITQTSSENEQRVFVIGALLLLGGAAAQLSLSALFVGFVAGVCWSGMGGPAREYVARDVRDLQHPLTVLLLVVAGARLELSRDILSIAVAYAVLRTVGKLTGGWIAANVARELPSRVGLALGAPGVVGIAIAFNVLQSRGEAGAPLFAIVIPGLLGAELLSLLAAPRTNAPI